MQTESNTTEHEKLKEYLAGMRKHRLEWLQEMQYAVDWRSIAKRELERRAFNAMEVLHHSLLIEIAEGKVDVNQAISEVLQSK